MSKSPSKQPERIALAYSGGLQSSLAIAWLVETYDAEVITVTLDLGQGEDLADIRARALSLGAKRSHVTDARDAFARDYAAQALKANAMIDDRIPMATALGRPLVAKTLVEIARLEDATTLAHAAAARDRNRLDAPLARLAPDLPVVAVSSEWDFSESSLNKFAEQHGITVPAAADRPYRVDRNLWGRSIGMITTGDVTAPADAMFTLTRRAESAPDQAAFVDIGFEKGIPTSVNGVAMPLTELIESLTTIAGEHGVGRLDRVKTRDDGTRSYAVYEMPASAVLHTAHLELDRFIHPAAVMRVSRTIAAECVAILEDGEWFSPVREALAASVDHIQQKSSGVIRLKLYKGSCSVVSRETHV
jgi:argininosuccinate synthase